jgi:integrase
MAKGKRKAGEGTIRFDEKKQLWIARYTLGYDDQGRQIRKSISSKSSNELIEKMKKFDRENANLTIEAEKITFGQWIYKWLYKIKKADLKDRSFQRYDSLYRNYYSEAPFADDKLKDVTMSEIKMWYNDLQTSRKVSIKTIKYLNLIMRASFADALIDRLVISNPTDKITFARIVEDKEDTIKAWTQDEQKAFVEHLRQHPETKDGKLLLFTLGTGLRLGEALALRWTDIDMSSREIRIRRALERVKQDDGSYSDIESTPKNQSSIRSFKLPEKIFEMLSNMQNERDHAKDKAKGKAKKKDSVDTEINDNDLVFPGVDGKYIFNKNPNRHLQSICKGIGINVITFHNLRHTFATRLFEKGVPIKTVQALLGHADIETTQNIYVHVMKATMDEAVDVLNEFL